MNGIVTGVLAAILGGAILVSAHQPVMDMAPRWANGYGIQMRWESFDSDTLVRGNRKIENPLHLKESARSLWIDGVYSFTREHRISFKLPYHTWSRTIDDSGKGLRQHHSGVGDVIIGFINKLYFNEPGWTGNLSFTPSITLPTGQRGGDIDIGHGVTNYGMSLSGSVEAYAFYGLIDWFHWVYSKQDTGKHKIPGNIMGVDIDVGIHPFHDNDTNSGIFVMLGLNTRWVDKTKTHAISDPNTGGSYTEIVPTFVWYQDSVMVRVQYHLPIAYTLNGSQLMPYSGYQLGAGIAF